MTNVFIRRQILKELRAHLPKKEITVLIGPRQSGKTTLLKKIEEELKATGKLIFYYNLDVISHKKIVENQTAFLRYLKNIVSDKPCFVIIDEIQRLENSGFFLKGIYDLDLPYKLIVSGSSSLEVRAKTSEPLTGRKKVFYLSPLNFSEFVNFKKPDIETLKPIENVYFEEYVSLLDEYLRYGGYPRVVLSKTFKEKVEVLEEIYSSYLEKDVKGFFQVRNETSFLTLVSLLAGQIGGLVNKNLLSAQTGSNRQTVDNFLSYLEKSLVIKIVPPFFRNPKKELLKSPKVYFIDLGLRNMILKNFNPFLQREDKGKLFENFVFLKILSEVDPVDKINHWRSKTKAEVDFVVQRGDRLFPIEAKAQKLTRPMYSRSYRSFINTYQPKQGFVINLSLDKYQTINSTKIKTLPFYKKIFTATNC